jgi:hypothetical protein
MKRQFFALSVFVLALGALATQSCEFTDGQNSYYNRGHYGLLPRWPLRSGQWLLPRWQLRRRRSLLPPTPLRP